MTTRIAVNPSDKPGAVMRRYVAAFGSEAYDVLGEDEDRAQQDQPNGYRARLLARAHAILHREEGRDQWGNPK